MESVPVGRLEVVKVATPLPFKVRIPRVELPFLKVTEPEGVPLAGLVAATVAVNVTCWLNTEGLVDELRAVVVEPLLTPGGAALPLLLPHPVEPVKLAVIVWLPIPNAVVLNEAWPDPLSDTLDAHTVDPSVKVTDPAGTPALEVVVEVKVTDWPKTEGFGAELAVV